MTKSLTETFQAGAPSFGGWLNHVNVIGSDERLGTWTLRLKSLYSAIGRLPGAQVVGAGMLRGLHDTRVPMIMAGVGYWGIGIGIGSYLAFGRGWDGLGIWIGLAIGLAVVALLLLSRWMTRARLGLVG